MRLHDVIDQLVEEKSREQRIEKEENREKKKERQEGKEEEEIEDKEGKTEETSENKSLEGSDDLNDFRMEEEFFENGDQKENIENIIRQMSTSEVCSQRICTPSKLFTHDSSFIPRRYYRYRLTRKCSPTVMC